MANSSLGAGAPTAGESLASLRVRQSVVVGDPTTEANVATVLGGALGVLPVGGTQVTGSSGNVAAATATATLTAVAGKTTYITGFEVTGAGATGALVVTVTVTGTITGTLSYTYTAVAGAAVGNAPLIVTFPIPVAASATNTNIVVSCPTLGVGNTNNTVVAHGFNL